MRRRDYELISAALKAAKPVEPSENAPPRAKVTYESNVTVWTDTVITVGEHLQADNPAFDQGIFAINCGVELA